MQKGNEMKTTDSLQVRCSLSISHRHYFSISHIQTAAFFSREAANIEDAFKSSGDRTASGAHVGYVTGAIFFAVSFLEAVINEIFCDAAEHPRNLREIDTSVVVLMAKLWLRGVPKTARYRILEKYEIALDLAAKEQFNTNTKPYQDIKLLVELRNALVHYEPETIVGQVDGPQPKPHKFEQRFKGRFDTNPLTGPGDPFYPDKCLSHGCAAWAVISAIAFADSFFSKFGISPTYEHVRTLLAVK